MCKPWSVRPWRQGFLGIGPRLPWRMMKGKKKAVVLKPAKTQRGRCAFGKDAYKCDCPEGYLQHYKRCRAPLTPAIKAYRKWNRSGRKITAAELTTCMEDAQCKAKAEAKMKKREERDEKNHNHIVELMENNDKMIVTLEAKKPMTDKIKNQIMNMKRNNANIREWWNKQKAKRAKMTPAQKLKRAMTWMLRAKKAKAGRALWEAQRKKNFAPAAWKPKCKCMKRSPNVRCPRGYTVKASSCMCPKEESESEEATDKPASESEESEETTDKPASKDTPAPTPLE